MGKLVFPGEWLVYVKLLTVIDVKLFMVQSVATRIKSINQSERFSFSKIPEKVLAGKNFTEQKRLVQAVFLPTV
jgi:hypothetical protein